MSNWILKHAVIRTLLGFLIVIIIGAFAWAFIGCADKQSEVIVQACYDGYNKMFTTIFAIGVPAIAGIVWWQYNRKKGQ